MSPEPGGTLAAAAADDDDADTVEAGATPPAVAADDPAPADLCSAMSVRRRGIDIATLEARCMLGMAKAGGTVAEEAVPEPLDSEAAVGADAGISTFLRRTGRLCPAATICRQSEVIDSLADRWLLTYQ